MTMVVFFPLCCAAYSSLQKGSGVTRASENLYSKGLVGSVQERILGV